MYKIKHPLKQLYAIFMCIVIIFTFSGCSSKDENASAVTNPTKKVEKEISADSDNEKFDRFIESFLAEALKGDTLSIHSYMRHPEDFGIDNTEISLGRYDLDKLGDTSETADFLTSLKSFNRSSLSAKQQLTYDELLYYLEDDLENADLFLLDTMLHTTTGIHIQLPMILGEYAFDEKKDIDDYILLLSDVDGFLKNLCDYEKLRAEKGYFMSDDLADEIVKNCQDFLTTVQTKDGVLVSTFEERINEFGGLSAAEIADYKAKNLAAIKEHVVPGYEALIAFVKSQKGTNKYSGGLCNYPNGKKYFEYILSGELGWSKSIDEFNKLVDSYLSSNMITMQLLMSKNPTLLASFDSYSFKMNDPKTILEDLKKKFPEDYPSIPETTYTIKYVSKALQESASPAMYFIPQIDNLSLNSIYINPKSTKDDSIYTTLAHEGYPGHLYQTQYFANTNPSAFRYIFSPGGYVEGWATYVELESYKYNSNASEALNTFYSKNNEIILLLYAKCDLGVNYYGWDENDIYKQISAYGFTDKSVAKEMYLSFVSDPGNYCKYVLGMMGFKELRKKAEDELGDNFVLKDFHQYVLDMGPIQFDILFKNLDSWIEKEKNKTY